MYIDTKMRDVNNNITYYYSLRNYKTKSHIRKNSKIRMKVHMFMKQHDMSISDLHSKIDINKDYLRRFLNGTDVGMNKLILIENVINKRVKL